MTSPSHSTDIATPGVALAIGAHPDDVEFGCGATLARWAAHGCQLVHVICTDGSKGSWDPDLDLDDLVRRREVEQRDASVALGGTGDVSFLGATDGALCNDAQIQAELAQLIRRHRPDAVLGHDPWKRYRLHPDHRHAGFLTIDSLVAARDPHFFPEQLVNGLEPHRPDSLLLFEADEPDHVEAADERSLAARIDALAAHRSQFETTHFSRLDNDVDPMEGFRDREQDKLAQMGATADLDLGEAFKLITHL
jgi:LmbE family N-acetylglucosaminyl deacetylase